MCVCVCVQLVLCSCICIFVECICICNWQLAAVASTSCCCCQSICICSASLLCVAVAVLPCCHRNQRRDVPIAVVVVVHRIVGSSVTRPLFEIFFVRSVVRLVGRSVISIARPTTRRSASGFGSAAAQLHSRCCRCRCRRVSQSSAASLAFI